MKKKTKNQSRRLPRERAKAAASRSKPRLRSATDSRTAKTPKTNRTPNAKVTSKPAAKTKQSIKFIAKTPKKVINRRAIMENIAPFVNFNYPRQYTKIKGGKKRLKPLSFEAKNRISAAAARIKQAQSNGATPFIVKSKKKRIEAFKNFAPYDLDLVDELKAVWVPTVYANGKKLAFRKGSNKPILKDNHTIDEYSKFNGEKLVKNPDDYLNQFLKGFKPNQAFTIVTANGDIQKGAATYSKRQLILKIQALMAAYQKTDKKGGPANHNFMNWLVGVRATEFTNQTPYKTNDEINDDDDDGDDYAE